VQMGTRRARPWGLALAVMAGACAEPLGPAPLDTSEGSTTTTSEPPRPASTDTTASPPGTTAPDDPDRDDADATGESRLDLGRPPVDPPAGFTEVTEAAGLALHPGDFHIAPFCILDDVQEGDLGDFCIPERFLGAAAAGDHDGDGWVDLYVTTILGPDRLMRNRGDGTFEDVTAAAGLANPSSTGGVAWADVDGDGDLDLLRTALGAVRNELYINDGTGAFTEEGVARGFAVETGHLHVGMGIGVGDYDGDGWLDVFVSDWHPDEPLGNATDHNRLLRGLGAEAPGSFEDVTQAMGIDLHALAPEVGTNDGTYGFAPAFVDLDDDGWPELTLAADFGTSRLWWNQGGTVLIDTTVAAGVGTERNGMGSTFGDYDGDGDLDWFVSAIHTEGFPQLGNRMYRNEGQREFLDVTNALGLRNGGWGWGAAFLDLEHDGDLDLALAAGWPSTPYYDDPVKLWRNDGAAGPWPNVAGPLGVVFARQGRGLLPLDYDRDGDLDLFVVANAELPALYRNDGASGHWLVVEAVGAGPNTQSLGAKVRVQTHADGPWQVREIGVGSHLFGQQEAVAHFGVGEGEELLHRVEVTWPASGQGVVLEGVARDQRLVVYE
jgi:enediyne biosynthesis protein E4